MGEVTLAQILKSREDRVQRQMQLLEQYQCPVVCCTMNIAGPVKNSPLIERGFRAGLQQLEERISQSTILCKSVFSEETGCLALYSISADAEWLKQMCIDIEEQSPLGRLLDLDVLTADGCKLSRNYQRGCLVCGAPGRVCAAGRVHSVPQLQYVTSQILSDHFEQTDSCFIADTAVQSLIEEAEATPKPGLVDRRNNGSHRDMCLKTFLDSANALRGYFHTCFRIGRTTACQAPEITFSHLRTAGIQAEAEMYRTTGGVNTHKGAIYSMGILCGSLGRHWNPEQSAIPVTLLMQTCSDLASPAAKVDFQNASGRTAGEQLYLHQGITGIRGEASSGFPSVLNIAVPVFRRELSRGISREEAGVLALLHLIACVQDTNLLHRGGASGAAWAAEEAQALLSGSCKPQRSQIENLDDAFTRRNLSPGGCADLLALVFFLSRLEDSGYVSIC